MEILGFQKTTLLDYPGHLAATIFTGGCNFRCPFCHNAPLLSGTAKLPAFSEKEVLAVLEKRRKLLEGVCITGGEPTLQPDLPDFIRAVKGLGLKVKLDTNGSRPEVLKDCLEEGLLDYVAMDIKNAPGKYALTAGREQLELEAIKAAVRLLLEGRTAYEFRTTVVAEYHTAEDMEEIGRWLKGAAGYYLQSFQASPGVLCPGLHGYERSVLEEFRRLLKTYISKVEIRGM